MSTEEERRKQRAARLAAGTVSARPTAAPAPAAAPETDESGSDAMMDAEQLTAALNGPLTVANSAGVFEGQDAVEVFDRAVRAKGERDEQEGGAGEEVHDGGAGVGAGTSSENDAPTAGDTEWSDTLSHDAYDNDGESQRDSDGETRSVEDEGPDVDDGKAGESMRQQQRSRGRNPRHGHGWLDTEAFTEHLRTARLRRIGTGEATVNVRVSAQLAEALEVLRTDVGVSKRDVIEALLIELVGPPAEGGRR